MGTIIILLLKVLVNLMGKGMNVELGQTKLFVGITVYTIGLKVYMALYHI